MKEDVDSSLVTQMLWGHTTHIGRTLGLPQPPPPPHPRTSTRSPAPQATLFPNSTPPPRFTVTVVKITARDEGIEVI